MESFQKFAISEPILKAIEEMGFKTPSQIQSQALPILLSQPTDFIGQAATGTGKTAAFGIPLLEQIETHKRGVQGLILCPTRELALQVSGQINLLGKYKGIRALPIYGGAGYGDQIQGLKQGVAIVVGTPGRLIDHMERGTLRLNQVKTIILDEADEMISMGFKEDLEAILKASPQETSQIWLFSATMSKDVRRVAATYLQDAQQVQVNPSAALPSTVEQIYFPVRESEKPDALCKIIDSVDNFYGIIFCQTKSLVTQLTHDLQTRGYKVDGLHGDKTQSAREQTMQAFRDRRVQILVCTDVASRGLDVKDVTHVINYSVPRELEVYVHRIGRTGRSGKNGIAMSLITPVQRSLVGRIEQLTKTKLREGKIPSQKDITFKKISQLLPKFLSQKNQGQALELFTDEWRQALSSMRPEDVAARFLSMFYPALFETRVVGATQSHAHHHAGRKPQEADRYARRLSSSRRKRKDRHPRHKRGERRRGRP